MINNYYGNGLLEAIFSTEDKSRISALLSSYDASKVNEFISYLNYLCSLKYRYMYLSSLNNLSHKEVAMNRENLLNKCYVINNLLTDMVNNYSKYVEPELPYLDIINTDNVKAIFDINIKQSSISYFATIKDHAEKLNCELLYFIHTIEGLIHNQSHYLSKGRKGINKDRFYTQLAELYQIYISEPTTSKDGDFANLVRIVNEILGMKQDDHDPSRAVKQAINDLRKKLRPRNIK